MGSNGHKTDPDVLVPDNLPNNGQQYGKPFDPFAADWKKTVSNNNITQIYHIPDVEDGAGILVRGNFINAEQADALALLYAYAEDEGDEFTKKLCRMITSASVGVRGGGRLEALFGGIGIVASRMWEVTKGLNVHHKKHEDEQIYKRSDFRQDGPIQNNGNNNQ